MSTKIKELKKIGDPSEKDAPKEAARWPLASRSPTAAWRALRRHAHEGSHLQARSNTPGRWRPLRPECCFRLPHSTLFAFTNRTEEALLFRAGTVPALDGRDGSVIRWDLRPVAGGNSERHLQASGRDQEKSSLYTRNKLCSQN